MKELERKNNWVPMVTWLGRASTILNAVMSLICKILKGGALGVYYLNIPRE